MADVSAMPDCRVRYTDSDRRGQPRMTDTRLLSAAEAYGFVSWYEWPGPDGSMPKVGFAVSISRRIEVSIPD